MMVVLISGNKYLDLSSKANISNDVFNINKFNDLFIRKASIGVFLLLSHINLLYTSSRLSI